VTNHKASGGTFGTIQKLLARRGARTLFQGVQTFGVKGIEFQSFYESRKLNEITLYFGKT